MRFVQRRGSRRLSFLRRRPASPRRAPRGTFGSRSRRPCSFPTASLPRPAATPSGRRRAIGCRSGTTPEVPPSARATRRRRRIPWPGSRSALHERSILRPWPRRGPGSRRWALGTIECLGTSFLPGRWRITALVVIAARRTRLENVARRSVGAHPQLAGAGSQKPEPVSRRRLCVRQRLHGALWPQPGPQVVGLPNGPTASCLYCWPGAAPRVAMSPFPRFRGRRSAEPRVSFVRSRVQRRGVGGSTRRPRRRAYQARESGRSGSLFECLFRRASPGSPRAIQWAVRSPPRAASTAGARLAMGTTWTTRPPGLRGQELP